MLTGQPVRPMGFLPHGSHRHIVGRCNGWGAPRRGALGPAGPRAHGMRDLVASRRLGRQSGPLRQRPRGSALGSPRRTARLRKTYRPGLDASRQIAQACRSGRMAWPYRCGGAVAVEGTKIQRLRRCATAGGRPPTRRASGIAWCDSDRLLAARLTARQPGPYSTRALYQHCLMRAHPAKL